MDNGRKASFHARLNGRFQGMLQWQQLDDLWKRVKRGQWYFYRIGETLPDYPLSGDDLARRVDVLDTLLRQEHDYHYCGIVYADDEEQPSLIKVYDPNGMGSSCSRSTTATPPGWILSISPPETIEAHAPVPGNRKRWWQLSSH
ncbi:MAG: hypothetical protein NUV63_00025 [Gallionella sp.]|nr:hypothetical protein [Gallionella sp.]